MGNCLERDKQQPLPLPLPLPQQQQQQQQQNTEQSQQLDPPLSKQSTAPVPQRQKIKETQRIHKSKTDEGIKSINDYMLLTKLGEGSFGKVKLAEKNGKQYAIKMIKKSRLKKKREYYVDENGQTKLKDCLQDVHKEIAIMKKMHHPNIIRLYEVIDNPDSDKIYMGIDVSNILVMECAQNGQFIDWDEDNQIFVRLVDDDKFEISKLRQIFRDIIKAIYTMHIHNIVHRDIKPQNIFFDINSLAKVGDFGVSQIIDGSPKQYSTAGTYHFMAPEQFEEEAYCAKAVDIWALGITFYSFVFLQIPFNGDSMDEIMESIKSKELQFPREDDKSLNLLISKCLEKDPKKRATIQELLQDNFLNEGLTNLQEEIKDQNQIQVDDNEIQNAFSIATYVFIKKWINNRKEKLKKE